MKFWKALAVYVGVLTLLIALTLSTRPAEAAPLPDLVKEFYDTNTWMIHNLTTSGTAWHIVAQPTQMNSSLLILS